VAVAVASCKGRNPLASTVPITSTVPSRWHPPGSTVPERSACARLPRVWQPAKSGSCLEVLGLDRVEELAKLTYKLLGSGVFLVFRTFYGQNDSLGVHQLV